MIPLTASTHPFTPDSLKGGGSSPPKILVHIPDYNEREELYLVLAAEGHVYHDEKAQREEALRACDVVYDEERRDEIKAFLEGAWQQLDNDIENEKKLQRRIDPLPPKEREKEVKRWRAENPRELSDADAERHDNIMAFLRKRHRPLKNMVIDNGRFTLGANNLMVKRWVKGWKGLETAEPQPDDVDDGMDEQSMNRLRGALGKLSNTAWNELVNYLVHLTVLGVDESGNFVSPLSNDSTPESSKAATGKVEMA